MAGKCCSHVHPRMIHNLLVRANLASCVMTADPLLTSLLMDIVIIDPVTNGLIPIEIIDLLLFLSSSGCQEGDHLSIFSQSDQLVQFCLL